jgi:hypothetical protein
MNRHHPFQIIGYHSCDMKVGMAAINGTLELKHSENKWDWLGWGVYFWEQNPEKALEYAIKCAIGKQTFSGDIQTPFVVGAIIQLGHCLNLTEPESLRIVKEAYLELDKTMKQGGKSIPKNKDANRQLDCAAIQNIHISNKKQAITEYDSVRSPFHEGTPLYETSNFTHGLHIEVCVRNTDLIKGYFLPRPIDKFNPFINGKFDKEKYQKEYERTGIIKI